MNVLQTNNNENFLCLYFERFHEKNYLHWCPQIEFDGEIIFVLKKCSANGLCWLNTCTRETGLSQWVVWETKDCQEVPSTETICKMWATKQCPQCIPSMLGTQRNPGQLQHQCRSFQHSPCRNTFIIHVITVLYDGYGNICEYFWVLSYRTYIVIILLREAVKNYLADFFC